MEHAHRSTDFSVQICRSALDTSATANDAEAVRGPVVLSSELAERTRLLTARVMFGEAVGRDLVTWACDLLTVEVSTDALVDLAALPFDSAMAEAEPLFRVAIEELGLPPMPRSEAGWRLAMGVARQMIEGGIPAHVGAGILWGLWWELGNPREVSAFVNVLDAWEVALPKERPALEAELLELAPAVLVAASAALPSA